MYQSWFYRSINQPTRKADHLDWATGDYVYGYLMCMHDIQLGQQNSFKFLCKLGWFLHKNTVAAEIWSFVTGFQKIDHIVLHEIIRISMLKF